MTYSVFPKVCTKRFREFGLGTYGCMHMYLSSIEHPIGPSQGSASDLNTKLMIKKCCYSQYLRSFPLFWSLSILIQSHMGSINSRTPPQSGNQSCQVTIILCRQAVRPSWKTPYLYAKYVYQCLSICCFLLLTTNHYFSTIPTIDLPTFPVPSRSAHLGQAQPQPAFLPDQRWSFSGFHGSSFLAPGASR